MVFGLFIWEAANLNQDWRCWFFGQGILSKTHFIVDSDNGVTAVSSLRPGLSLGVFWVVPEHPNPFTHIWQWQFRSSSRPSSLLPVCCCRTVWSHDLGICGCLEMSPRDLTQLCKSTILLHWLPWLFSLFLISFSPLSAVKQILFMQAKKSCSCSQSWSLMRS